MKNITEQEKQIYYQALLSKDIAYEGIFYVGVKTTGVFCRPTCPARKPKFSNCEFYKTAQEAVLASYRPCMRCNPLYSINSSSNVIKTLIEEIEKNPEKKWKEADFRKFSIDVSTARRQFKKRFGMTFVAYARNRRIGMVVKDIRNGGKIIDAQLNSGYESSSGFRDAFQKIIGSAPSSIKQQNILNISWFDTILGPMLAISDENTLYLLEFTDRRGLEKELERLKQKTKSTILPGETKPIASIKLELEQYYVGKLKKFQTPIHLLGSNFQKQAWQALINIPYGEARSYAQQAQVISRPNAYRAVANANGANQLAIIVPCHRIINSNGDLGGYGGGVWRKKWLLEHEKNLRL